MPNQAGSISEVIATAISGHTCSADPTQTINNGKMQLKDSAKLQSRFSTLFFLDHAMTLLLNLLDKCLI
jgi:hypothetical protein